MERNIKKVLTKGLNSLTSSSTVPCTAFSNVMAYDICFHEAAQQWLNHRRFHAPGRRHTYIKARTEDSYERYISALNKFFGEKLLCDIATDPRCTREYQEFRAASDVGPNKINQEMWAFREVLKFHKLWNQAIAELYQQLRPEKSDKRRALSAEEQAHWLRIAYSEPKWRWVYHYSVLGFDTCMSSSELRSLHIGDIRLEMECPEIFVRFENSKEDSRNRRIAIERDNLDVMEACGYLLAEACRKGAKEQEHYLFPKMVNPVTWNPAECMHDTGMQGLWAQIRAASGLKDFTVNCVRHTGLTRLAESGAPPEVIKIVAGHELGSKAYEYYVQISMQAQRQATRMKKPVQNIVQNYLRSAS